MQGERPPGSYLIALIVSKMEPREGLKVHLQKNYYLSALHTLSMCPVSLSIFLSHTRIFQTLIAVDSFPFLSSGKVNPL